MIILLLCGFFWFCRTPGVKDGENGASHYEVTKEIYNQTFAEVNYFIKKIHSLILKKDFDGWQAICTGDYIRTYSSPDVLRNLSEKPQLKEANIKLTTLKDYFLEVFIPSRINTRLDKIEFVTKNRVKALSIISEKPYVVYLLEKDENNEWKIGLW